MITLHRMAHWDEPFQLNPDLIATVEARPDTVLRLTTGRRARPSQMGNKPLGIEQESKERERYGGQQI